MGKFEMITFSEFLVEVSKQRLSAYMGAVDKKISDSHKEADKTRSDWRTQNDALNRKTMSKKKDKTLLSKASDIDKKAKEKRRHWVLASNKLRGTQYVKIHGTDK